MYKKIVKYLGQKKSTALKHGVATRFFKSCYSDNYDWNYDGIKDICDDHIKVMTDGDGDEYVRFSNADWAYVTSPRNGKYGIDIQRLSRDDGGFRLSPEHGCAIWDRKKKLLLFIHHTNNPEEIDFGLLAAAIDECGDFRSDSKS